jgi:DNA-binding response OmpR family regulator
VEGRSVLVVEDDGKLADVLVRAMRREGLDPVHVTTGDGALAAARADPAPSAVVLDIMIPHPDGIEVCRQLRRDGWSGPIVAVSALDGPDMRTHVRGAGADVFMPKPFQLTQLIGTLLMLLGAPRERTT